MAKIITDATIDQMARDTGKLLAAEEKVTIMIALDNEDPNWHGCINGFHYDFPKGKMIDVPKSLAELIRQNSVVAEQKTKMESKLENTIRI